jgi:hypothetical protein
LGSEFVVTIDKNLDESSFNKVIEKDSLKWNYTIYKKLNKK